MLSWIPFLGPIIQGIFSIFNKMQDNAIVRYTTDANRDIETAKVSANIIEATKDDIGLRIIRDAICLPVAIWAFLIGYDTIVSYRWPEYMFRVNNYPDSVGYLPYAVLTFLLGNIGINAWIRK